MKKEGRRISKMVSRLLSFAGPGALEEKRVKISIKTIIFDTLIMIEAPLKNEGINTLIDVPQNLSKIWVNSHQIQQVFLNIIKNARYALNEKYETAHVEKRLEISVREQKIDDCFYVMITFCDYGIGIPGDRIDKVTDAFFTTKTRKSGTGFGLSICRDIITEHGGKLIIEGEEGQYTCVTVALPVLQN